jgi:surfactin synthase thioesterase subunit
MSAAHLARYIYNPRPFPGKVTLFKTDQNPWYIHWDPMEKWPAYVSGEFEVRKVPGGHGNLLFEPNVRELTQQLNECLRLSG